MRVLHFFKTYLPETVGGIEQVIYQICESGRAHGIESQVLTLSREPEPADLTVGSHRVRRVRLDLQVASTGISWRVLSQLKRLAAEVDVVNYHFPWPFMDVLHFAARIDKPAVVTYHSDIVRQRHLLKLYRPLMHRFLSSVERIVTASPNYLATSEVLGRYRDKTVVIPYGLDRSSYPPADPARLEYWRRRFGDRFFLFVGVMRYYKGLHILLEAARGTDYPIVIVGSGPLEGKLKAQARNLGLSNVHFAGRLEDADKAALLELCSAMVFPSHLRSEAFGISLLEGAMYGKPLISAEIGTGTSYINVHGETGLVVPPADPVSLREAMRALWNDPRMAAEMGRQAEQRYRRVFTAERMGQQLADLYRDVLAGRRRG